MDTLVKNAQLLTEPKQNENHTGYDSVNAISFCTPTYFGFGACAGVTATDGYVVLQLTAKTPIGDYTKSFKITKDITFTWSPISRIKISVSITNFKNEDGFFSFDFKGGICGKIPFLGWKCKTYSHHFSIADNQEKLQKLSDQEFSNLLAITSVN